MSNHGHLRSRSTKQITDPPSIYELQFPLFRADKQESLHLVADALYVRVRVFVSEGSKIN